MQIIHCGTTYECAVAVKCDDDNYIKLYDENGVEIAAFYNISDFSDFEISGGSFIPPCDCTFPIVLTVYTIGGRTITTDDWILSEEENKYYYEIESNLISANSTTCNILLSFAPGTELEYNATQAAGKVTLFVDAAPLYDVVIEGIQITRV